MSRNKNKNSKNVSKILKNNFGWILFFMLAIAVICFVVLKLLDPKQSKDEPEPPAAPVVSQVEEPTSIEEEQTAEPEQDEKTPSQYEGEVETGKITADITHSSYMNDTYTLRVMIEQVLNTGKCILTMNSGSHTYTKQANLIVNPSSSACDGFSVARSNLKSGTYDVVVEIYSGSKSTKLTDKVVIP